MTISSNCSVTTLQLDSVRQAECHPVHLLPCRAACIFSSTFPKEKTVSFRGRGLKGQEFELTEVNKPGSDQEVNNKHWKVFHTVTYWNLETPPNSDDGNGLAGSGRSGECAKQEFVL
uniref:Uncharacterized protein n=1 Tax=Hucho hucho TaxID=62062 RepID=A0A4W5QDA9_9TELE